MEITHNSSVALTLILDVFEKSIRTLCVNEYTNEQIEAWVNSRFDIQKWEQKRQQQQFWFAWEQDELIGFCSLEACQNLDLLYVKPAFKKQKVAANLLQSVLEYAQLNQVKFIRTEASLTAVPFFEKFGFIKQENNSFLYNGIWMENVSMQLELNC